MDVTHVEKYALHLYKYVHNVQNIWHTNNKRHGMGEEAERRRCYDGNVPKINGFVLKRLFLSD